MLHFVVQSSEIESRLDAGYYLSLKDTDYQKIRTSRHSIKKLRELSSLVTKGESPLWQGDSFLKEGIPFLRGKNIKEGTIDFDDVVYISEDTHDRMRRSILNDNYLLLTMAGTLGDVAFFKKEDPECNINQDIAKIKLTDNISYEYATVYFQTVFAKKQINILSNGGTRSHLNFEQIKSFDVILPPRPVQDQIVEIMQSAYFQKKQKDAEAQRLLDSIDDYVLDELGIKIPELEDKMCFVVDVGEVRSNRVDAYYYQPKFEEVDRAIEKGKFEVKELKEAIKEIKKGIEVGSNSYVDEGIPFVRVADIDDYKIYYEGTDKKINNTLYQKLKDEFNPKRGDILYSKDGTIGLTTIVEENKNFIISGGILRLIANEGINNFYLKTILSNKLFKIIVGKKSIGAIIKHLLPEEVLSFKIPLPPLEIQNKIAEEVKRRISDAERLKAEASRIIEEAKKKVEGMILGD